MEIAVKLRCLRPVANRIESGVRTEFGLMARVHVAQCAQVQLFRPVLCRVKMSEEQHHERSEFFALFRTGRDTRQHFAKDGSGTAFTAGVCIAIRQPVIGKAATALVKIFMAMLESAQERSEVRYCNIAGCLQALNPRIKSIRL